MNDNSMENVMLDIKYNTKSFNLILAYIFSVFNVLILANTIFFLRRQNTINLLKYRVFAFLIIDCIYKLIYGQIYDNANSLSKELFFTLLSSGQFFLIISLIYQLFNKEFLKNKKKNLYLINRFKIIIGFILIIFPYDKFFNYPKTFKIIEIFIIISFIIQFFRYSNNNILEIINNLRSEDINMRYIFANLKILSLICLIVASSFYFLELISVFITNYNHLFLISFSEIIVINGLKYFTIFVLGAILHRVPANFYDRNIY